MGWYDDYEPVPPVVCPVDGRALAGDWQGKDGPCEPFHIRRYRQGDPLDDTIIVFPDPPDDVVGKKASEVFPDRFAIYGASGCDHWIEAHGVIVDGIWSETVIDAVTHWDKETRTNSVLWGAVPVGRR